MCIFNIVDISVLFFGKSNLNQINVKVWRHQLEAKAKAKAKVKDTNYTISRYSFVQKQFKVCIHKGNKDRERFEIEQNLSNPPTRLLLNVYYLRTSTHVNSTGTNNNSKPDNHAN